MKLKQTIQRGLMAVAGVLLSQHATFALSPLAVDVTNLTYYTQQAHNIEAWWEKEVVQADVVIDFGENRIVDGTFTFEAHGPRARYDRKDGVSIIFDGETAWVHPPDAEAAIGRFHVFTGPWFIMAPFKMKGDGIQLSEAGVRPLNGKRFKTMLQTFGGVMGDTPDDWYRFYIGPKSNLIAAMSCIVIYGKDTASANKQPSIIRYFDYTEGEGPRIATRYELWYLDPDSGTTVGKQPKGTGTVSDIRYLATAEADFRVPENARELELPRSLLIIPTTHACSKPTSQKRAFVTTHGLRTRAIWPRWMFSSRSSPKRTWTLLAGRSRWPSTSTFIMPPCYKRFSRSIRFDPLLRSG